MNGGAPVPTTASAIRTPGATTLSCVALTHWPVVSAVHFVTGTPMTDAEGNPVINPTSLCLWKGIVSGTTITGLFLEASATGSDPGNSVNDIVQMAPDSAWAQDLYTALTNDHSTIGYHKKLTDINNKLILDLTATTNAVNNFLASNAAAAGVPTLSVEGSDTNINLGLAAKGTGFIQATPPSWQYLGYIQQIAGQTGSGGTETLVPGLTINVTIPVGCTAVKLTAYASDLYSTASGVVHWDIWSGATSGALTTQLQLSQPNVTAGNAAPGMCMAIVKNPTAGSIWYSVGFAASGGNPRFDASATAPAYLLVEVC